MSYVHRDATWIRRDDQRLGAGGRTRYVMTGSQSEGDFGLFESILPPGGGGPGPHYHEHFSESFYVLEGHLAVLSGDKEITVDAGDVVYVPRQGVHGFRNGSGELEARFLILFTPGAPREEYFDGMAELRAAGRQPSIEEIDEFARRYDQINIRNP